MTKWKEIIDEHLGSKPKFHDALQQQILQKAQQQKRLPLRQMATTFAFCIIALLWLTTATPSVEQIGTQHLLVQELSDLKIVDIYVADTPSKQDTFIAQASTLYSNTTNENNTQQIKLLQQTLHDMVLAEEIMTQTTSTDLRIVFENGEQLLLKLYDYGSWVGITDVETRLFYIVEGGTAKQIIEQFMQPNSWLSAPLVLLLLAIAPHAFLPFMKKRNVLTKHQVRIRYSLLCIILSLCIAALFSSFIPLSIITCLLLAYFLLQAYGQQRILFFSCSIVLVLLSVTYILSI